MPEQEKGKQGEYSGYSGGERRGEMTSDELGTLTDGLREQYADQLAQLGPRAFTKKTRESLIAGFSDGVSSAVRTLRARGALVVKEG